MGLDFLLTMFSATIGICMLVVTFIASAQFTYWILSGLGVKHERYVKGLRYKMEKEMTPLAYGINIVIFLLLILPIAFVLLNSSLVLEDLGVLDTTASVLGLLIGVLMMKAFEEDRKEKYMD